MDPRQQPERNYKVVFVGSPAVDILRRFHALASGPTELVEGGGQFVRMCRFDLPSPERIVDGHPLRMCFYAVEGTGEWALQVEALRESLRYCHCIVTVGPEGAWDDAREYGDFAIGASSIDMKKRLRFELVWASSREPGLYIGDTKVTEKKMERWLPVKMRSSPVRKHEVIPRLEVSPDDLLEAMEALTRAVTCSPLKGQLWDRDR